MKRTRSEFVSARALQNRARKLNFDNNYRHKEDISQMDTRWRTAESFNSDQISTNSETPYYADDIMLDEAEQNVEERFGAIVTKHRLTRSAIKDLANLLVSLGHNIHIDARTICKTSCVKLDTDSFKHLRLTERGCS